MAFYDRDVDVLISEAKLQARIRELGAQLTKDYASKELTLLAVLKGSVFFLTDLARAIDLPLTLELLGVSSYQGGTETTGEVRITSDVTKPMAGKDILVVEDIIDTGLTMKFLLENLRARHPASLKLCAPKWISTTRASSSTTSSWSATAWTTRRSTETCRTSACCAVRRAPELEIDWAAPQCFGAKASVAGSGASFFSPSFFSASVFGAPAAG
jgi:hypoxanthine phosphoribosyltransferase